MTEYELFQKSFSKLHASHDTLHKVLAKARGGKKAVGMSRCVVVLASVIVVMFSMALVGYATGWLADLVAILTPAKDPAVVIDDAFGDNISTEKPKMEDAYGNSLEAPEMDRLPVDMTEVERLIGAYISDVDGAVSVGNNTFTLKNFLIDETGSGAITWTLENPDGIEYGDAGYGRVYFNSRTIDNPLVYHYGQDGNKKDVLDMYTALISKNEAGTKLELVSYFGTVAKYETGDTFVWVAGINRKQKTQKIQITPVVHIPTMTLTTETGMKLHLANHGLTIDVNGDTDFITDRVVIKFKDGTQYCVEDDEQKIFNTSGAFWRNTEDYRYDDLVILFNRLIVTNEVSSVEVTASWLRLEPVGDYYEPVLHPEVYTFYP